jgi:hypothetical protein
MDIYVPFCAVLSVLCLSLLPPDHDVDAARRQAHARRAAALGLLGRHAEELCAALRL